MFQGLFVSCPTFVLHFGLTSDVVISVSPVVLSIELGAFVPVVEPLVLSPPPAFGAVLNVTSPVLGLVVATTPPQRLVNPNLSVLANLLSSCIDVMISIGVLPISRRWSIFFISSLFTLPSCDNVVTTLLLIIARRSL